MLEVKNLTVTYTKTDIYGRKKIVIALDNISFNFTGNILGILGETGSGKTTLAKALAGLIPYSGS
ncbi:MAG: ATP-binding cassette domain-containing protein, partial [bacterium]|nr:ATP-binding cassette domain-containing protein [bacterium]